ncbi:MAG: translation elongation factor Ts [Candidatus Cardinium sp.]|uniref:translation elongation factor Ts n=1 Tax=Cardinium endosymbiont of Dermatophagoides farinae TaxID=2597823 RepID=UPI0011828A1D|nr:translation elongation factor Ts [Cardinium endosymbiont of Dermatophagoides farinae]TSJ81436.1 elongation factor Ts [Cardinium endosymbiont of Dermatophagoides farinae]UWW96417.1 MAG: translation elongation factor Ts [Candidatus Cardinium sp.]
MVVTAQEVAALRKRTGAGMMDCKKALIETGGDFEQAIDLLRKKGQKILADRAGHHACEGAVFACASLDHKEAFLLVLNCETDFVAKNELFLQLGKAILEVAAAHKPSSIAALEALPLGGGTVQEAIIASTGTTGEKITISTYETLTAEVTVPYIHTGNRLAVLVALQGAQGADVMAAGKDVAMQIAAMNPIAVDKDQIDPTVVERESAIIHAQLVEEGHDAAKAAKITQGRLHKFFQENTLLQQPFVKNGKVTVAQHLQTVAPSLTVTTFKRIGVGG